MTLTKYQRTCYKWLGHFGEEHVSDRYKKDLQAAHMEIRPGAYMSYALLSTLLVVVGSACFFMPFLFVILPMMHVSLSTGLLLMFLLLPVILGALTYVVILSRPASRAKVRKKKIDTNLSYAVNFISAMSSAGVTPTEIFKSLSKQEIYSEITEEAAWIYRDVELLGLDILTAIKTNIERTPSDRFKEFLQGMVVTVTSGGSLKTYFMHKADQYMWENRQVQKQLMETLGIMAESYVTAAVAGILLLLIVIPLMMIISGGWNIIFLMVLILMVVPLIHVGFAVVIRIMSEAA
jgi:archaeal flagellar protein FlaJ